MIRREVEPDVAPERTRAHIESQAALAASVDVAMERGEVKAERNGKGNPVYQVGKQELHGAEVDRWRKLAAIPQEEREAYYSDIPKWSRDGLLMLSSPGGSFNSLRRVAMIHRAKRDIATQQDAPESLLSDFADYPATESKPASQASEPWRWLACDEAVMGQGRWGRGESMGESMGLARSGGDIPVNRLVAQLVPKFVYRRIPNNSQYCVFLPPLA